MLYEAAPTPDRLPDDTRRAVDAGARAAAAAVVEALRAALERAASSAPGEDGPAAACALTVPAGGALAALRPADAWGALADVVAYGGGGDAFCWSEPVGDGDVEGPVWSFAGAGVAVRIEAAGPERVEAVMARARTVLARLREVRDASLQATPRPSFFGGVAFAPAPAAGNGEVWRGFADASFVLPRWLLGTSVSGAFLRFTTERTPRSDEVPGLLAEARAVVAALASAAEDSVASNGGRATARSEASRAPVAAHEPCGGGAGAPSAPKVTPQAADAWAHVVGDAVARIGRGEMTKVVASTRTRVDAARAFDVRAALRRLDDAQPQCVRFATTRGAGDEAAVFLGATPERLVDKRGPRARLDALAGTVRRDRADAQRTLLHSDKDRREHAVVVDFLREALAPLGAVRASREPGVRALRDLLHLWTPVEVTLAADTHVLELVARLHPTPAVCGTPPPAAHAWVREHEPSPRGWYAGALGWFDGAGDGSFAVALRSALVRGCTAWLFAGAGIVAGSVPESERAEVELKQRPMLDALGVER